MMTPFMLRKIGLGAAAASALAAVGVPLALAAPAAVPPSDSQGYLDSTARCSKPDTAVVFGATKTSRVAICRTAGGSFEYHGVRMSDGATLVAAATQTSGSTFIVKNEGVVYTITPTALSVTANGDTFRTETWSDFHSQQPSASSSTVTAGPSTSAAAPATPGLTTSAAPKPTVTPTSAVPLPPPMAAEAGGSPSSAG